MKNQLGSDGNFWERFGVTACIGLAGILSACSSGGGGGLVTGPGAGGGGILQVTPPAGFSSAGEQGGPFFPLSNAYTLSNPGGDSIDWTLSTENPGVLFLPESGTLAAGASMTATIYLDTGFVTLLSPGDYELTANFVNETNNVGDLSVPVSLSIAEDGELDVSPAVGFSVDGIAGGPFSESFQEYTLFNSGLAALQWEGSSSESWVVLSSLSGTLEPSASTSVTIAVNETIVNTFGPGTYVDLVNFREAGGGDAGLDMLITLNVDGPASMSVTPFDGLTQAGAPGGALTPEGKTYTVSNVGDQAMPWSASSNNSLVSLSPNSGTLSPGQSVQVFASSSASTTGSMSEGNYTDQMVFTNLVGDNIGSTTRPFVLELVDDSAELTVAPTNSLNSSGPAGGPFSPIATTYTLANIGGSALSWSSSTTQNWIQVIPAAGTLSAGQSTTVTVAIDASIAGSFGSGNYSGTASILWNGAEFNRSVSLTVDSGQSAGNGPLLPEGSGFSGDTAQPGAIGSGPASGFHAIAKLDVVPWQEFTGDFEFGVPAFHHRGIDRVEFSLNGGSWIAVDEPSLNPRTGVVEYWVKVNAGQPGVATDRLIEVRVIAYPVAGIPRVLTGGFLNARPNGSSPVVRYASPSGSDSSGNGSTSSPYKTLGKAAAAVSAANGGTPGGGVVRLFAGNYGFTPPSGNALANPTSWLTVEPAEGVTREQVKLTSASNGGIKVENVRLHRITVNKLLYSTNLGGHYWFDEADNQGPGREGTVHAAGWYTGLDGLYWTDGIVRENQLGPCHGFVRNMTIRDIGEDVFRGCNPVLNVTVDNVRRGNQTSWHPDLFVHPGSTDNQIYYGVRATNIEGQGLFYKYENYGYRKNHAIVNVLIEGVGPYSSKVDCHFDHIVMRNCTIMQTYLWLTNQQGNHCYQGNIFAKSAVGNSTSSSYGSATISSVQTDGLFENNHSISSVSALIGTNATTGPILWADADGDYYRPLPGQGLKRGPRLVETDVYGTLRPSTPTIGAIEE